MASFEMTKTGKSPNILFLMSDEHRPNLAGFLGDDLVRTPTLDALAAGATIFDNAYTPAPICIPARQSLATGRFPRSLGVERFGDDLEPGAMTFARRFSQHGYQTVACGKLHHLGQDQMQGWRKRIGAEMDVSSRFVQDPDAMDFGQFISPAVHKWSMVDEIRNAGLKENTWGLDDALAVEGALTFIDRFFNDEHYGRATPEVPLLLKVSLNEPHYPFATSRDDLFDYYYDRVPLFMDDEVFDHPFLGGQFLVARPGKEVSEHEARSATAAYYAMIETVDERFGRIIAALERVGQDINDWIIVYTSDHGEMLGQHGVWEKQKFFEASARVPLFIRAPGRLPAGRVAENVNLCDLFATLCELASIPAPDGLDSRSLSAIFDESAVWDNETVSQFDGRNIMIKRDALKYSFYADDGSEVLFDLAADPLELRNRIADPEYAPLLPAFRARRRELRFGVDA